MSWTSSLLLKTKFPENVKFFNLLKDDKRSSNKMVYISLSNVCFNINKFTLKNMKKKIALIIEQPYTSKLQSYNPECITTNLMNVKSAV